MSERETPADDPEQGADPRVLALLRSGAPANGIDLAPWWRANATRLAAPPKPTAPPLQTWARYAAVFVVGASLGFVGGRGRASTPAVEASAVQACQYSEPQRSALTAVLDASSQVLGPDSAPRRTALLTLCSTCHGGRAADEPADRRPL